MDNRFDYENSLKSKNNMAANAEYAQDMADTAEAHLGNVDALNKAVDATNRRTDEYTTKATAADLSAANDARDAVAGKDWPGRTKAKWEELGETAKAKGQEVANNIHDAVAGTDTKAPVDRMDNAYSTSTTPAGSADDTYSTSKAAVDAGNSHITDPVLREKMDRKDEDFGDKVKDVAHDAGDKLHEGFDKVKGFFNKDDDASMPR